MNRLINLFVKPRKHGWLVLLSIPAAVIVPLLITDYVNYKTTSETLTVLTLSRREATAHIAAIALKEKFDRVVDVGISFATRVQFRKLLEENKWNDAVKILETAPRDFPYIDTMALFNPSGTLMAVAPPIPEVVGQNFSYRDYYQGVSREWKPYVSDVFKRAPEPRYNVVSVAVPIKSELVPGQELKILGIVLLTIKLDTILDWARDIEAGEGGFAYFVDRNGSAAGHPKFSSYGEIANFSDVPAVQRALRGERGVEVLYNPVEQQERISAYEPVPMYGWGVVVQQPTQIAFASREASLKSNRIKDGIVLAFAALLGGFMMFFASAMNAYRQKEAIMLGSIGDGLVAIDRSWNITLWNDAASQLTGWIKEEALGRPFRDVIKFVREDDRKENITFIEETMLFGKVHYMQNHTLLVRKDGREVSVGDSAAPVFDQGGSVSGAIVVFRDISKEHDLEEAREEFASLATHQLRAPITVIRGFVGMLGDESALLNADQKEALHAILKATDALNELINAMLNVSRIESGAIAVSPEPAYLPDIADGVLKEMSSQIKEKNLRVEKQYGDDIPSISADPKLIGAVFENLLSNAVKYTLVGGKIALKIEKHDPNILIAVSDTGIGVPKAQQAKLFTKFFRAENVRTAQADGTGLGLYIVKSIVEGSGGTIRFESQENTGTTFFVTIPLAGMKKKEGMKGLT